MPENIQSAAEQHIDDWPLTDQQIERIVALWRVGSHGGDVA